MNSASTLLLCRRAVSLTFSFFVAVTKPESLRQSINRLIVTLLLIQPMLINATPFVHGAEATAQRGVAKFRSWLPKTIETKAAEAAKPMAEKAIGIDEWMTQSTGEPKIAANRSTNFRANSEAPMPPPDLKNFTTPFKIFPAMTMFQSGTSLEMVATGTPVAPGTCTTCALAPSITPAAAPVSLTCPTGTAVLAPSGTGVYRNNIYWLNWSCGATSQFNPGDTITKTWTTLTGATITATIRNITKAIRPYNVGDWGGDKLDDLYGGINPIGLLNVVASEDPTFDVSFSVLINGVAVPADIVTADAEDTGNSNESLTWTTDGTPWQPLEAAPGSVLTAKFSNGGRTLYTEDLTNTGGGTLLALSQNINQISVNVLAGGSQAVAFGIMTPFDYGDAPASFGTPNHYARRTASGGSQLTTTTTVNSLTMATLIPTAPYLGSVGPDPESSAQSSVAANGDDNNGTPDDEDGVASFPALTTTAGQTYTVPVNVTNPSGTSYLVGYIDFNKDGDFLDTGEKSATVIVTASGSQNVSFTTPAGMTAAATYARFRLSNTQAEAESSIGNATSGEVEDYSLTIVALPLVTAYKSVKLTTDADSSGTITAGDTLTYTLQYANTGAGDSTNFQITDLLPAGISIAATGTQTVLVSGGGTSASANTGYTGGIGAAVSNLLASGATLAASGVITVSIPVRVNTGFSGTVINQASGTGTALSSSVLSDNAGTTVDLPSLVTSAPYNLTIPAGSVAQTITGTIDATTFIVSGLPDLKLAKTAPASVQAGASMTYTMTVTNVGNGVTFGTTSVKDTLPTGITVNNGASGLVTLSGSQAANWTCNSDAISPQSITCTSTTAIAATSGTSVFAFNINAAATLTTDVVNQAKVFSGGDPNKATVTTTGAITACTAANENTSGSVANAGCAFESTPVVNIAAYKSIKLITDADASGGISAGDTLNYTIHYINLGSLVTNFQINDQLPTGITITTTGGQTVLAAGSGTGGGKNPAYTGAASGALSNLIAAGANLNITGAFTITIPVTMNAGFTGTIANQATGFGSIISLAGINTDNAGQTSDMSATVTSAPYNMKIPVGSIPQTIATTIDPTTVTVGAVTAPSLTLRKSVNPTGEQPPATELTYSITFTNTGGSLAKQVTLTDAIPLVTDFKIGSVTTDPGSTGLTIVVEYSNDYNSVTPAAATWTYTPVNGGGGTTTNYDRNVKAVRWRVTAGYLSSITPDNSGEVGFTVIIR